MTEEKKQAIKRNRRKRIGKVKKSHVTLENQKQ